MFCENCGAKLSDTAKFCRYCGAIQTPTDPQDERIGSFTPASEGIQAPKGEKKALIEYLDTLYTAEMGVEYCDQLIRQLEEQKQEYQRSHAARFVPGTFNEDVAPRRDIIQEHLNEERFQAHVVADVQRWKKRRGMAWYLTSSEEDLLNKKALEVATAKLQQLKQVTNAELNRRQAEEDRRYARDLKELEARRKAFQKREEQRKEAHRQQGLAVCHEFDQSIQEIQEKKQDFCIRRDALYKMELLYERFRNPVAESQLRDYLEMGLVDRLEGPQGGYAFYLSELQAQHICGSIRELQVSMENRMDEISVKMSRMVSELHTANQRLNDLRSAVFDCCEAINVGFLQSQATMKQMTARLKEEIAAQARPIREVVQRSEYNLYLEGMRRELDRSHYGRLQPPGLDLPR